MEFHVFVIFSLFEEHFYSNEVLLKVCVTLGGVISALGQSVNFDVNEISCCRFLRT